MKVIADYYEKCYCGKLLTEHKIEDTNSLVFECDDCGYTYTIHFTQLLVHQ